MFWPKIMCFLLINFISMANKHVKSFTFANYSHGLLKKPEKYCRPTKSIQ